MATFIRKTLGPGAAWCALVFILALFPACGPGDENVGDGGCTTCQGDGGNSLCSQSSNPGSECQDPDGGEEKIPSTITLYAPEEVGEVTFHRLHNPDNLWLDGSEVPSGCELSVLCLFTVPHDAMRGFGFGIMHAKYLFAEQIVHARMHNEHHEVHWTEEGAYGIRIGEHDAQNEVTQYWKYEDTQYSQSDPYRVAHFATSLAGYQHSVSGEWQRRVELRKALGTAHLGPPFASPPVVTGRSFSGEYVSAIGEVQVASGTISEDGEEINYHLFLRDASGNVLGGSEGTFRRIH